MYRHQAIQVFAKSVHPLGFLAAAKAGENYERVWSRDSAITALAVLLCQETALYPAIKQSILTLGEQQKENGLLPSNVGLNQAGQQVVSYGTLVGRVDAQTWWIIQSCLYLKETHDEELATLLLPKIERTLRLLEAWEFNNRHLVYTPLGGNWADEYILTGYTLYDNLLRYWALMLVAKIWPQHKDFSDKASAIRDALLVNFTKSNEPSTQLIHGRAKQVWEQNKKPYLPAAFDAAQYLTQWDAAANGLALLLGFKINGIEEYITHMLQDPTIGHVPAFWPVIKPTDPQWALLEQQYNYQFKNAPYHFHNGGSWPVMSGLLSLGLNLNGQQQIATQMRQHYELFLTQKDAVSFSEYINVNTQQPGGKKELCFSAAGYLFMSTTKHRIQTLLA
ncbi:MAG: glycoside hydrolase 100 family protein [Flavobacteriales bacterium]